MPFQVLSASGSRCTIIRIADPGTAMSPAQSTASRVSAMGFRAALGAGPGTAESGSGGLDAGFVRVQAMPSIKALAMSVRGAAEVG